MAHAILVGIEGMLGLWTGICRQSLRKFTPQDKRPDCDCAVSSLVKPRFDPGRSFDVVEHYGFGLFK
ncbi:hypothetical protein [Burkholderia seminalis]|uniref:hypothetical protein n=1 Tax=Burkholderia seminalis TaxID=488731 RepID=UPI002651E5C2|nr:hypothetical protein [Burkholderia seminalis]MDN7592064.1 hypothetical protein [Burkholderia seminalis]